MSASSRLFLQVILLGGLLIIGSCSGGPVSSDGDPIPDTVVEPDQTRPPQQNGSALFLRKLTRYEYNNTVRDLLNLPWSPADLFGPDLPLLGFENNASINAVTPDKLFDYVQAAEDIAAFLSMDIKTLTTCNPGDSEARECLLAFLHRFLKPIYRSPLLKGQRDRLLAVFDQSRNEHSYEVAFDQTMRAAFLSPLFLYRMEKGAEEGAGPDALADPYDLATRLSYFLWASTPDEALLKDAAQGKLKSPEEVLFHAQRMIQDPKFVGMLTHFHQQWLGVRLSEFHPAFVQASVPPEVLEETTRFMSHVVREGEGTLASLFLSPYSIMNQQVALHYDGITIPTKTFALNSLCQIRALSQGIGQKCTQDGKECPPELSCLADLVDDWYHGTDSICVMSTDCATTEACQGNNLRCCSIAASGGPKDLCLPETCSTGICDSGGAISGGWAKVDFEGQKRLGILTQASVLTAHADVADRILAPIRRGRFVRERLLCQPVQSPPPGVPLIGESEATGSSVQDILSLHTTDPSCSGCHNMMDKIGFAFEDFGATGQTREFDSEGLPIQTEGEIIGTLDIDGPIDGIEDLAQKLASSEQVHDCFIRQWWRFTFGRVEGSQDAADLESLLESFLQDGGDIEQLLLNITQTEAFLRPRSETP